MRGPVLRAVGLVVLGVVSVQIGAAFAKGLFDEVSPAGLAWLRVMTAALVLCVVVRPRLRGRTPRDWQVVIGFGLALCGMNWAIYESFARIPLGLAVTLELTGPLLLAVVLSHRRRDLAWVGFAALGVALLGLEPGELTVAGVVLALVAGACWAAYILLSASTGRRWEGLDGLAVASVVGAVALAPGALLAGGGSLLSSHVLLIGLVVGLLSSVLPYSCELIALRTLSPAVFGVLMSLEPAAAALAAAVILGELLGPVQWLAIACVVAASAGSTWSGGLAARADPPPPPGG